MVRDIDDKFASVPTDETTAEMDVIKDLFGSQQPPTATVEVFSQDLFSEPPPPAAPAAAPTAPAPAADSALPYQPKHEENIKVVTDDDLRDLFAASAPGHAPVAAPTPAEPQPPADTPEPEPVATAPEPAPEPEPVPAESEPEPEPEPEPVAAAEPAPIAQHVDAEELSLESVTEISPLTDAPAAAGPEPIAEPLVEVPEPVAEPAPEPAAIAVAAEEIGADIGEAPVETVPVATPVEAVDFKREHVDGDLGAEPEGPTVDTHAKLAIVAEAVEIGQIAEEVAPAAPVNPLEDISPDEILDDLENKAQVGEMTCVAAGKKGELLQKTESLLRQLEPPGKDLLSAAELTKLHNNMSVLVEWARTMSQRMDRLETALAKLCPEDQE